jgi:hypothetical protein
MSHITLLADKFAELITPKASPLQPLPLSPPLSLLSIPKIFEEDLPLCLHKALLTGEYYHESEVEELRSSTNDFNSQIVLAKRNRLHQINGLSVNQLNSYSNDFFSNYLNHFLKLADNVKDKAENFLNGNQTNLPADFENADFSLKLLIHAVNNNNPSPVTQHHLNKILFTVNLVLCYCDEFLECSTEVIRILDTIRTLTEKAGSGGTTLGSDLVELNKIFKDKQSYLKYKIGFRVSHLSNTRSDRSNSDRNFNGNSFENFYKKTVSHFEDYNLLEFLVENESKLSKQNQTLPNFILEPYHHLRRIICKSDKPEKLKRAKTEIESSIKRIRETIKASGLQYGQNSNGQICTGDTLAFLSSINYLQNAITIIDLKVERLNKYTTVKNEIKKYIKEGRGEELKSNFLAKNYRKIKNIADQEHEIRDYYLLVQFFIFLNEMLTVFKADSKDFIEDSPEKKDEPTIDEKRERVRILIAELEKTYFDVLKQLKERLLIWQSYKALPIYLTLEESKQNQPYPASNFDIPLFLRSSYVLPINYDKIKFQLDYWESLAQMNKTSLRDTFEIALNQKEINNSFADFDKKVREYELKTVQIVAMFVSIATFVLLNVKIFDNKTGIESFAIILGLAGCFVLFNLFFYMIILAQYKTWKVWHVSMFRIIAFFIMPVLFCLGSWFLLRDESFKKATNLTEIEKRIHNDSLRLEEEKNEIKRMREQVIRDSITIRSVDDKLRQIQYWK